MALNPLAYTEKVVQSFLRYQLTTYPFADPGLNAQMRALLSLDTARETPLLKGPFVSLSRAFRAGAPVDKLIADGVFHPHLQQVIPFLTLFGHQEEAIRAISDGKTTLVSTGTGSGKSECFLYPIISRCLTLRDEGAVPGLAAVIVYPMNALAEDQLGRLRELLAGTRIPFGMYVGKTPQKEADVTGERLPDGASRADYREALLAAREKGQGHTIHPPEEICSREIMRTPGHQPRILLTTVKQLELLLTRQSDIELFQNAQLDFLVFDEAHTFTGAQGAETACLIRRLRSFCGRSADETVCVATSATIVDEEDPDAARAFASRFFGVARDRVEAVHEAYEAEVWDEGRSVPAEPGDAIASLREALAAVDAGGNAEQQIRSLWRGLAGTELAAGTWEEGLHDELSRNELVYQAADLLERPRRLGELLEDLSARVGRSIQEEELILWLTLGAAARKGGRPLIRPVVHAFLRGVQGAVVTYEDGEKTPTLHLSAEDEGGDDENVALRLRVSTCTTCGQHYFEHSLSDFDFTGKEPGGGVAEGDGSFWESLDPSRGGVRLLLLDRLISSEDDEEDLGEHRKLSPLFLCRRCGAAHPREVERCLQCGEQAGHVELFAVQQSKEQPGNLTRCICCGANGRRFAGRYREPAKQVRATNVADVHVLAQDMIAHAERKRLLVFADNRQDAAFQAGWMRDHARRFRLRALLMEALADGPKSVGDLTHAVDQRLEADDALSRALAPEVWTVARKEAGGKTHRDERHYFLRIVTLQEVASTPKQRIGLEPWGRLRVEYAGLSQATPFVVRWANKLSIPADELADGIAALLDMVRRKRLVLDRTGHIYSRFWGEGDREIQNGYLQEMKGIPRGLKLTRGDQDHTGRVDHWLSRTGHRTTASEVALKWGVSLEEVSEFLTELWALLISPEVALLAPVTLTGWKGRALPHCSGTYQLDADKLILTPHTGYRLCTTCRRRTIRRTPGERCLAWRCDGKLKFESEPPDSYDLHLIDQRYEMLRPREHTAMVPHPEREKIEELFKGDSEAINTLVCTQTLELGVDIGALDAVLMRNVPPLPANYWQRAGRAGRRHRMAVNLTYSRPRSHDRAYFSEPLKMLEGRVEPPSFNLANSLMVAKHVHAAVITRLHQLGRDGSGLGPADREEVRSDLAHVFPSRIRDYLFDDSGFVRTRPRSVRRLHKLVTKHRDVVENTVSGAFSQGWPEADIEVVKPEVLTEHVIGMTDELEGIVRRLFRRLRWAMAQMESLENLRRKRGDFDAEQQAFYYRCRRLVQRLKGTSQRQRRDAEGIDDTITFSVLAAEGFLPGYGLESGSVLGMAEVPRAVPGLRDFDLPRAPSVAIREYVPGNLIYANGQKFLPRRYVRETGEDREEPIHIEVDPERHSFAETAGGSGGTLASTALKSIRMCDVTLVHASRISDEEDHRFQMGVTQYGRDLEFHSGGRAYRWGTKPIQHRKGHRLQLANVGATSKIDGSGEYGYLVCLSCGQSVSPYASDAQIDDFVAKHEEWCQKKPGRVAFHTDLAVDTLTIPECESQEEAVSLAEAIRFAAADVLDMDREDLQVLVLGAEGETAHAILYDPMPGGSGLLEKICERFEDIVEAAGRIADCPALCATACIDCFQTYRNAFVHRFLDRRMVLDSIDDWGTALAVEHDIPPLKPEREEEETGRPVNEAERKLKAMLRGAGFGDGIWQRQVPLRPPLNSTTPDVTFEDPDYEDRFVFIYMDGLSDHLHGNAETRETDNAIRSQLLADRHDVIVITWHDLGDQQVMTRHFKRLARRLIGRDAVKEVETQAGEWFAAAEEDEPDGGTEPAVPDLDTLLAAAEETTLDMVARCRSGAIDNVIPMGSLVGVRWIRPGDERPENGSLVVVRNPELTDPDLGVGFAIGELRTAKRTDQDGKLTSYTVTVRPKTREPEYRRQQISVPVAEWDDWRPLAVIVGPITSEEHAKWHS